MSYKVSNNHDYGVGDSQNSDNSMIVAGFVDEIQNNESEEND
ncbi:hypothetical protein [Flavobacterium sp.]|nr:hypothetical protein [Flavobacterium sp.]